MATGRSIDATDSYTLEGTMSTESVNGGKKLVVRITKFVVRDDDAERARELFCDLLTLARFEDGRKSEDA